MRIGQSIHIGYIYVVLAALLWAVSGAASKFLFNCGLSAFQLVQLRTTISAVVLVLFLAARGRISFSLPMEDIMFFVFLGTVLAAVQFTYLFTVSKIPVAAAVLMQYQAPVLIAIYAFIFDRARVSAVFGVSVLTAMVGCWLMVGGYNLDMLSMNKAGIISGLASAAALAVYSIKSEQGMLRYSPWTVLCFSVIGAAVLWNIFHPPFDSFIQVYPGKVWGGIVFIGVFGTVLPYGLYNEGIRLIGAARANVTATLEPVMAGFFAYAFLGETLGPLQILGACLVIASIVILRLKGQETK